MTFCDLPGESAGKSASSKPNGAGTSGGDDGWPEPIELPGLPPVPAWSEALLPDVLRPWLSDAADVVQCPPEYLAVGAMVSLASVVGRACTIRPKKQADWTVVPNLWGAVVGRPSALKSPALEEALRPVTALAANAAQEHASRQFERDQIEARQAALRDAMKKEAKKQIVDLASWRKDSQTDDDLRREHEALEADAAAANETRRFIINDTTVEKLGEILAQSPRGILLYRDELSGWMRTLDKVGHENDRGFYLQAWNGNSSYTYDRISRGTVHIDCACVSILGGIQPGPLGRYLRAAMDADVGADGLMQRFQLLVYPDDTTEWRYVDRWSDTDARRRAREMYHRLAYAEPETFGAEQDGNFPFLRFDAEAQEFFAGWYTDLMTDARSGEHHEAIEGHLGKYPSLMASLALLCHLADSGTGAVGLGSAQRAAAWCTFLGEHMRRVYASVASARVAGARSLLARIRSGAVRGPFTSRDVYRHHWSGLDEPKLVDAAVGVLVDHGWLRRATVQTGGRPRDEIHVHPQLERRR